MFKNNCFNASKIHLYNAAYLRLPENNYKKDKLMTQPTPTDWLREALFTF